MLDIKHRYIYKSNKNWRGKLIYSENGTYITKWFRGSAYNLVSKQVDDFILSYDFNCSLTFRDFINNYYFSYKKKELKLSSYSRLYSTYKYHCSVLDDKLLCDITSNDCKLIVDGMIRDGFSKSSVNKIYQFFNNAFNYAISQGFLKVNPVCNILRNKGMRNPKKVNIYTYYDISCLEKVILLSDMPDYKYSVMVLYYTGLRLGELLALTPADIDFDNNVINVTKTLSYVYDYDIGSMVSLIDAPKTDNAVRAVPIGVKCLPYLQKMLQAQNPYLVCTSAVTPLLPRNYTRMLQRLCLDAGIPFKGVHALRHTFATRLIQCGVDIVVVSRILGHANVKITYDIYVDVELEDKRRAVDML